MPVGIYRGVLLARFDRCRMVVHPLPMPTGALDKNTLPISVPTRDKLLELRSEQDQTQSTYWKDVAQVRTQPKMGGDNPEKPISTKVYMAESENGMGNRKTKTNALP